MEATRLEVKIRVRVRLFRCALRFIFLPAMILLQIDGPGIAVPEFEGNATGTLTTDI